MGPNLENDDAESETNLKANKARLIWLVNDDPSQLFVQKKLLGRLSFEVKAFSSPLALLNEVKTDPTCVNLVSDFHMPEMDGVELTRIWCTLYPNAKVLLLSASLLDSDENRRVSTLPSSQIRLLSDYRLPDFLELSLIHI